MLILRMTGAISPLPQVIILVQFHKKILIENLIIIVSVRSEIPILSKKIQTESLLVSKIKPNHTVDTKAVLSSDQ